MLSCYGKLRFQIGLLSLFSGFWVGNASAADTINGGQVYAAHCAACHGSNGVPVMPNAPNFARSERLMRPDVFVAAAIRDGNNAMPSYQGVLSENEILDVVVYLRTLEKIGPVSP